MEVLIVIVLAYFFLRSPQGANVAASISSALDPSGTGGTAMGQITFPTVGPNSDSRTWFDGIKPGTVTVSGQRVRSNYTPGTSGAQQGLGFAGQGIGAAEGIASSVAGLEGGTSVLATSTTLGAVTMGIGIVIGVAATIVGMISAHHKAALAAEGRALNDADARMLNAMVLVMQGVLNGEISSIATVQGMLQQIGSDWYAEVKPVQRGTWHYSGQDLTADYQKVWIQRTQPAAGAPGYSDYHAPDPCNGACVIGHFFTERNQLLVLAAATDALAGNHGQLMLPEIPAHDTQSGAPEVTVTY